MSASFLSSLGTKPSSVTCTGGSYLQRRHYAKKKKRNRINTTDTLVVQLCVYVHPLMGINLIVIQPLFLAVRNVALSSEETELIGGEGIKKNMTVVMESLKWEYANVITSKLNPC